MQTGTLTSRAEAIKAAARDNALTIGAPASAAFAALKSLYAAAAPVATRHRPAAATALFLEAAERAGIDPRELSAANAVPLMQGIDPALCAEIYRVACELAPAARAATAVFARAKALAYAAQERLLERPCTVAERDNFKSRVMSRLLQEVADLLCERPGLLGTQESLTRELHSRVAARTTTPGDERWNTSWLAARRRENGTERTPVETTSDDRARWEALVRTHQAVLRRAARRIAGSAGNADDVMQSSLEHLLRTVASPDDAGFVPLAIGQMRRTHADQQSSGRDRAGHRAISVDWTGSDTAEHAATPEQGTFGSCQRESQARTESIDGRLDAQRALDRAMSEAQSGTSIGSSVEHTAVLSELGRIVEGARRGERAMDALTDREQLIRHLGRVAHEAGATSPRLARRIVLDTLDALARH